MTHYRYHDSIEDLLFNIEHGIDCKHLLSLSAYKAFDMPLFRAVLEEGGKFASEHLSPLNRSGDKTHAKLNGHCVIMPKGFKDAYMAFAQNGWNALPFDPKYGGQGLPWVVNSAIQEMVSGANMAFGLCPLLTQGAIDLLSHHGSEEQKDTYLPPLIQGNWTGTMCLTEAGAGSDLGEIKTKAIKTKDHYLIEGQKIFITFGEHDMSENIIHMVLARIEGAPKGSKGISLFIVPKIHPDGTKNDVNVISLEHKLGIHASPTCVMSFGDEKKCIGYLVGHEHEGLKYMFTMMNQARLSVGIEAIGVADYAYQQAVRYADERIQMGKKIKDHPDVNRMLLNVKSQIEASRALALFTAFAMDVAKYSADKEQRQQYNDLVAFLIPIVKSHSTQTGFDHCSSAMQIMGGVGYTEEMPVAQAMRDCRITMIYEGTNGIQALDLLMRKLTLRAGALFKHAIFCLETHCFNGQSPYQPIVSEYWSLFKAASDNMQKHLEINQEQAQFLAHDYLTLCGIVLGAVLLLRQHHYLEQENTPFAKNKHITIGHYINYILPSATALANRIKQGHES